jgi:hypothetical protein
LAAAGSLAPASRRVGLANVQAGKLKGARGRARGVQPAWDWSGALSSPREYPWRDGGRLGVMRGRRPGDLL